MNRHAGKARIGVIAILCAAAFVVMAIAASSVPRASVPTKHPGTIDPHSANAASAAAKLHVIGLYGKLPLSFEPNLGQTDKRVKFLSHGRGYSLFLTSTEAVLALRQPEPQIDAKPSRSPGRARPAIKAAHQAQASVLRVKLVGANGKARSEGIAPLAGRSNYLIGNDPRKWHTNVPTFGKVGYRNVYPGIDLIYYGTNQRQLEYDFIVAPGADPKAIGLRFSGAKGLRINDKGNLVIAVSGGEVIHHAPVIYQESGGKRQRVAGRIAFRGKDLIGFEVASWDRSRPLLIDPPLVYSTYLGGKMGDGGNAIAVDGSGDAYVTGETTSANFPTTAGAFQTTYGGGCNAFVTELNPSGSALLYSTYLGGSSFDYGYGIALDASGDAYVTGVTYSSNFPTTAATAYQTALGGSTANAFVTELNPSGTALLYSTYLGGSGSSSGGDSGNGIALDASDDAYVTGGTYSNDFPITAGVFQTVPRGSNGNAFVAELNPAASGAASLVYSTYLGGSKGDYGNGIALDASGDAYVTGLTYSTNFPTTNALCTAAGTPLACCTGAGLGTCPYQSTLTGGGNNAFVTELNPSGSAPVYSTYLGGSYYDEGYGIALDASGDAYVTGLTASVDFPTTNALCTAAGTPLACCTGAGLGTCPYQSTLTGTANAFVAELNPSASGSASLVYSTYLGGSHIDSGHGIAVDASGDAYVTGETTSANFPTMGGAFQTTYGGGGNAFVTKVNPSGSALVYSTYLGGTSLDYGNGIVLDASGDVYVTGLTTGNFPVTAGAFQTTLTSGAFNAFVSKLSLPTPTPTPTPTATSTSATPTATPTPVATVPASLGLGSEPVGDTVTKDVTIKNTGRATLFVSGASSTDPEFVPNASACAGPVAPAATCTIAIGFTPSALGAHRATLTVNDNTARSPQHVALYGAGTIDMTVTPTSYTFGGVKDLSAKTKSITVHNYQTNSVSLSEGFSGSNPGDFSVTGGTCTSTLAETSACALIVTFAPTAVGAESATMTVTDSPDPLGPYTVRLSGTGVTPLSVSPASLAFGAIVVGHSSTNKTVTLTNTGSAMLTISKSISGSGDFAVTGGTCIGTLAGGGAHCTYLLKFTPGSHGAESATLGVSAVGDAASPHHVSLTGTGA